MDERISISMEHYRELLKVAPEPLSPSPEIRYQLRNWHHVTCAGFGGQACTCLAQREALIAGMVSCSAMGPDDRDELKRIDAQIEWLENHWGIGEGFHKKGIRVLRRRKQEILRKANPSVNDVFREKWDLTKGLLWPVRLMNAAGLTMKHYRKD